MHGKRPVLRFVLLFALFMLVFHLVCTSAFMTELVFPAYLRFNARVSGSILGLFEDQVAVAGQSIHGRYALTIERGCDAIEPSALFLSGVLAFPSTLVRKLPGMLIGTVCLMVLNMVRIISLFYIGVYWPSAFEVAHVSVWQALFIFSAIVFWVLWAVWSIREVQPVPHAAPEQR
ncbi:MAG: exosortase H [Planctomycetes bacterium]|nr:exosortase H [Planctomycetota bacterium]